MGGTTPAFTAKACAPRVFERPACRAPARPLGTRRVPSVKPLGTRTRIDIDSWYTVRSTLWALDRGSDDRGHETRQAREGATDGCSAEARDYGRKSKHTVRLHPTMTRAYH